jgi:hypothetical protein
MFHWKNIRINGGYQYKIVTETLSRTNLFEIIMISFLSTNLEIGMYFNGSTRNNRLFPYKLIISLKIT